MDKFAFRSEEEKAEVLSALSEAPDSIRPVMLRLAADMQKRPMRMVTRPIPKPGVPKATQPPLTNRPSTMPAFDPKKNYQSEQINQYEQEHLQALRATIYDFLTENGLQNDENAKFFVEKMLKNLSGVMTQYQPLQPAATAPHPEGSHYLEDISPMGGAEATATATASPTILTREQKISPGKNDSLMRPQAESEWGLRKESKMEKDDAFDQIVASMLELSDMADEAGMLKSSDRLASILPALRTVKVAQYEGFQNYWIANGRAFEMAYKQKRKKGKNDVADYRSPHQVWFEILDEYQKSLLTNQADFISRYAGKTFEQTDKSASELLMKCINARMESGESPGVAVYAAIDDMGKGRHFRMVGADVFDTLSEIESSGNEKMAEKAKAITKIAEGWFGKMMRFLGFNYGNPTTSIPKVLTQPVKNKLVKDISQLYFRAKGTPTSIAELHRAVGPYYDLVTEFVNRAKYVKRKSMPELMDINSVAGKNGMIDAKRLGQFINSIQSVLPYIQEEYAQRIDKDIYSESEGMKGPAANYLPDEGPVPGEEPAPSAAPATPPAPPTSVPPPSAAAKPPPPASAGDKSEGFLKDFNRMTDAEKQAAFDKLAPVLQAFYKSRQQAPAPAAAKPAQPPAPAPQAQPAAVP